MAARPPSDVAEAVRDVVAAFDKAVNLVRRIEDRKDGKSDPESVRDLYKSLALGPTIVQGYFDADSKRLGHAYAVGDFRAQMELRDVLLHLRTLIGDLQDILLDEKEIDFRLLQDASDHCRVNAGVCLGQLSQRLANPNPMYMQSPPAYMSGVPPMHSPMQTPGLHYSHSQSTHSSIDPGMPMTPEQYPPMPQQDFSHHQWDQKRPEFDNHYTPEHHRQNTDTSLQESFANWPVAGQYSSGVGARSIDRRSDRRPSSNILSAEDGALLSPGLSQEQSHLLPGQQDLVRNSYTSFEGDQSLSRNSTTSSQSRGKFGPNDFGMDQRPTTRSSHISRERFGPDDFGDVGQPEQFDSNRGSTRSVTSYASLANETGNEFLSPEHEQITAPAPLRFGNRNASASQPLRQASSGGSGAPSLGPDGNIPGHQQMQHQIHQSYPTPNQIAFDPYSTPLPMPTPMQNNAQGVSSALRSQSMAVPNVAPGQRFQSPQPMQPMMSSAPYPSQSYPITAHMPVPNMLQTHHPSLDLGQYAQSPVQMQGPQASRLDTKTSQSSMSATSTGLSASMSAPTPQRADSTVSLPRPMSMSQPRSVALSQLSLPTEKNPQAFCKGAYRLFVGAKKGIIAASRPLGMTATQPYWRCDKCLFEGPMHSMPGPPDKKGRPGKPEKVFDPTTRECGPLSTAVVGPDGRGEGSGGIRFKWVFLAKCHVPLKMPPEKQDGTAGSFCCIFCVAESSARGWLEPTQSFNDAASTHSGRSGSFGGRPTTSSGGGTTRVFGNFTSFMDHLQTHRREELWPGNEMRTRMKCIVGRVATRAEDWEVNFLPIESASTSG